MIRLLASCFQDSREPLDHPIEIHLPRPGTYCPGTDPRPTPVDRRYPDQMPQPVLVGDQQIGRTDDAARRLAQCHRRTTFIPLSAPS